MPFFQYTYLFICSVLASACTSMKTDSITPSLNAPAYTFTYNLSHPDTIYNLDYTLNEISGLTFDNKQKSLLAINDEMGEVFYLDPYSGNIKNKLRFGKSDDYEGITLHDNKIFVTESNGNIKVINAISGSKLDEFNDVLSPKNDIEGLSYNAACDCLLLAAKGNSKIKGHKKHHRSIFAMDLRNGKVSSKPFLDLSPKKSVKELSSKNVEGMGLDQIASRLKNFAPSGIAIQPKSEDIFILSSSGHLLVVTDQKGSVKSIQLLDRYQYRQPEGICFDDDGNLYLSSEGKGGTAKLFILKNK